MPAREAVARLVAEGALKGMPNGRVQVPRLARIEFEELVEVRLLMEPLATAKAAQWEGARLATRLAGIAKERTAAIRRGDSISALLANYRFHFAIYEAARSPFLSDLIASLWLRTGPMVNRLLEADPGLDAYVADAAAIGARLDAALKRRDPAAAAQAMHDIIETSAAWYRLHFPFTDRENFDQNT